MEWLEQNIDAYRIVFEILGQLRVTVREGLEQVYGEEWYRKGLPQEVFDRLIASKEREKSIDWYDDTYQQIMDYVTFPDLVEILQMNAEHFPEFTSLAPSESLLNARFLELDVMRSKLGRARPVSETELSFLTTFHLRFQKAMKATQGKTWNKADDEAASPEPGDEPDKTQSEAVQKIEDDSVEIGEVFIDEDKGGGDPSVQPAQTSAPHHEKDDKPSPPKRLVQSSFGSAGKATGAPARSAGDLQAGPAREPSSPQSIAPGGQVDADGPQPIPDEISSAVIAGPDRAAKAVGPKKLREALSTNDHLTVLREIYREVSAIAEGVWSQEVTPNAMVWEQVTASDWYEVNFSRLGLQPLSSFYEVTEKVDRMVRSGADKPELHEFLKETNFASTLLALRDMFQANNI